MAALVRLQFLRGLKKAPSIVVARQQSVRSIATSPKKDETTAGSTCEPPKKNWVSYGFNFEDKEEDRNAMHASFFFAVTLVLVGGTFVLAYQPDPRLRDWAQREAYLELRRREELGLPPIDRNYLDPALMVLPSDEELGDAEIVI